MAKDYASQSYGKRSLSRRITMGLLLLLGVCLIASVWFLSSPEVEEAIILTEKQLPLQKKPTKKKEPQFEFYTLLPKADVTVARKSQPKEETAIQIPEKGPYLLQVASFRRMEDAKRLIRDLKGLGYIAKIQAFTHKKTTWHRVVVGPYDTKVLTEKNRKTLLKNHFKSIIIKGAVLHS